MRASLVVTLIAGCLGLWLAVPSRYAAAQGQAPAAPAKPATPGAPQGTSPSASPPTAAGSQPSAQAAPAAATPSQPAAPAPAAPAAPPPAASPVAQPAPPTAAGAVPPPSAAQLPVPPTADSPDTFDLKSSLRGPGPAMTSDDVAKRAAQTAPSIAKAQAASRRAALVAEQVNVALWPRLDLQAQYTFLSDVPPPGFVDMFPPEFAKGFATQHHTGTFGARLVYPVSTIFFSIIPNHKAALKSAEAQKLQERVEKIEVELQARESYYNYARSRAGLYVALSAQAQAEAHQRDVTALVNAGSLARVELMQADAQVAQAAVAVARLRGTVATVRAVLFTLTHHDGTDDLTLSDDFQAELPPLTETADAILAKALANRSELRQLRTVLEALEHSVDAAQGQELPVLSVGAQADYANPNQRYFGAANDWNESWALFAALTWSPNDWAYYDKSAEQGRADIAQTLADLERLEDALRVEVARAYEDYTSAQASLVSSRIGIAAADESYRVRREQFRAGAAVATDVIDAEIELRNTRLAFVNAVIDMRIAKARLDRAVEAP